MSTALQRSLWWLAAIAVAVIVLLARLQLSFDLSAFFPRHTTLAHEVLIEQVRNGPASRLLVIGVGASTPDDAVAAGRSLQQALTDDPAFVAVLNGEFDEQSAAAARVLQHIECDAPVQVPLLHGQGDEKAAEVEVENRVGVGRRGLAERGDFHGREENQRDERRDPHVGGLRRPPDRHPQAQGRGAPGGGRVRRFPHADHRCAGSGSETLPAPPASQ